ncbi:DUF6988 family protein [Cupriavidus pinatubonensis]|uniref:DUF6988 family protein n=1 Tax=Cupriavidus pinatubonensis TaxID=248026 RepID=UPI0035930DFF
MEASIRWRRTPDGCPIRLALQVRRSSNGLLTMTGMTLAVMAGNPAITKPMSAIQPEFADCPSGQPATCSQGRCPNSRRTRTPIQCLLQTDCRLCLSHFQCSLHQRMPSLVHL